MTSAPGFIFSEKDARRIANVVRTHEAQPVDRPNQRRRPVIITRVVPIRLTGKDLRDIDGVRYVAYSLEGVHIEEGLYEVTPGGVTSVDGADEFANPVWNIDEFHRGHVKHTGLEIHSDDTKQRAELMRVFKDRTTGETFRLFEHKFDQMFPVKVTKTGGSAGDQETQANFEYKITDFEDNVIADTDTTAIQPIKPRPPIGVMLAAPAGSTGWAFWDPTDLMIKLWDAGETLDPSC